MILARQLLLAAAALALTGLQPAAGQGPESSSVLRVCADPNNLPESNDRGEGYENRIAAALAHDLGRKIEYTYFPQRMGFVRNTLRAWDEVTQRYKCDLIMGVPKGYELTATTEPYMRSIYAMVVTSSSGLAGLKSPEDLLKLPPKKLHSLHIGLFGRTPAVDWVLKHGLIDRAVFYPAQSGDPAVTVATTVEQDLASGKIDAAILWGPFAGYLVNHHKATAGGPEWIELPFKPDPAIRMDYEISMGLRQGEKAWQQTLNQWISGHREEIAQILTRYHVPLLRPSGS